ncbi:MAG TPA: nucleoside-diphosphate kinase [Candidatus Saccharimonadia bacterium]|nr:nucleoside-diphosphate kinase [Candidatus Saccharimonadia bacterium]
MSIKQERTFMLVKPDGVKRGLIGEIIGRIERRGLKVIAIKMLTPDEQQARRHYPAPDDWCRLVGEKTMESYAKYGKDPMESLGTIDYVEIGKIINEWNIDYLTSGPVVAMIVEGVHAIDMVRKIVGKTFPSFADPGTIRGDFSVDSPNLANDQKRAVRNLIHASGDAGEAKNEMSLWFAPAEISDYKRTDEDVMF